VIGKYDSEDAGGLILKSNKSTIYYSKSIVSYSFKIYLV